VKARLQQPDGNYLRAGKAQKGVPAFSSQEFLMRLAEGKTDLNAIPRPNQKRAAKAARKPARAAD
jgi:polyphosphate kinase